MNFNIGDKVTFTKVSSSRGSISMSSKNGTVKAINGDIATVLHGKKTFLDIPLSRLSKKGEKSHLTSLIDKVFEANRKSNE